MSPSHGIPEKMSLLPLGTFSCDVTHTVNNKTIRVLVDANAPKQSRIVGM